MNRVRSTNQISRGRTQNRTQASFTNVKPPAGLRARGRRGESLASPRDRQRLRERNSAERERVEGMLASSPVPVERRAHHREACPVETKPRLRALQPARCPVCGDRRVVTDEVNHGGTLRMSECLHCEHRWTQRPKGRWVELGTRMNRVGRPRAMEGAARGTA